jgi:hypothetical protein
VIRAVADCSATRQRDLQQVEIGKFAGRDQRLGAVLDEVQGQPLAADVVVAGIEAAAPDHVEPVRAEHPRNPFARLVEIAAFEQAEPRQRARKSWDPATSALPTPLLANMHLHESTFLL